MMQPNNYYSQKQSPGMLVIRVMSLSLLLPLLGQVHFAFASPSQDSTIRVGIFNNKPMCYFDEEDKPAGIFVSVMEYV
ncbi:MAG: hypothetical protein PF495_12530, partial [Spirochaetales bacterium]|nr:hypothetical protein [Spirochaetales bacterium]